AGPVRPAAAGTTPPGVPPGLEQPPERTELQRVTPAATRRVPSEPAEPDLGRPPEPGRLVVEEGAVDAAERALSASGQRIAAVERLVPRLAHHRQDEVEIGRHAAVKPDLLANARSVPPYLGRCRHRAGQGIAVERV